MAAVKMSPARARALGISTADAPAPARPPPSRSRRKPGGARHDRTVAVCHDCSVELVGETAARRHVETTGHCRHQLVLDLDSACGGGTEVPGSGVPT
jgi:hypothetical protein